MAVDDAIRYADVSKAYGPLRALAHVDLVVREGEFFGIIGENGAGKTTLIKCLLDFCEIDHGQIEIFGVPSELVRARSVLAYLPERFSPPFYLTGADFLRYMAHLHGHGHDEARVRATVARLELDATALARPARGYSKGMAQKLALAACLLSEKKLYVLDEPASGLDPRARALLKAELRRLHAGGNTLFLASHALADVEALCDRMAVIHRGTLLFIGTPAELTRHYGAPDLEQAFLACTGEPAPA